MGEVLRKLLKKHPQRIQRALEMLPGITVWTIILFPIWGAFIVPRIVAYFTIAFLVYWFYKSFGAAFLGTKGYFIIRRSEKTSWYQKYKKEKKKNWLNWQEIKHLIIIPNYNESVEKLSITLDHVAEQKNINKNQLWVVLAMEERAQDAHQRAKQLIEKYQGKFGHLMATFHPTDIVGEIKGKASNEAWAAKETKRILIDQEGHDIKKITITSCDADSCLHPKYFAALTYQFAANQNRYLRFWQSPIFWHNNFWRVPAFIRIVGTIGNIVHIANLLEPDSLVFNYSTYSASMKMLDDVGYWHTDIIPEDWHIFLQCFFHKKGKVEVAPIFLPTSIDAPEAKTYWGSLKNRYEQCKRHAWGATDIPFAVKQAIKHPEIPLWTRFFRVFKLLETHLVWTSNWAILTLGAWLPAIFNPVFKQTALGYNLPKISHLILTTCLLFLLMMIILDRALRPQKPKGTSRWQALAEYVQWVLMPVASLLMSVLPGLDSQTKLMLGKRIEYQVTEKV